MAGTAYKGKSIWAYDPSFVDYSAAHHQGAIVISLFGFLSTSTVDDHGAPLTKIKMPSSWQRPSSFCLSFSVRFFFSFQINQLGSGGRLILIGKSQKPWLIVFDSICAVMQNHQWHFQEWWCWWCRISLFFWCRIFSFFLFRSVFFNLSAVLLIKWLIYSSVQLIIHIESPTHLPYIIWFSCIHIVWSTS